MTLPSFTKNMKLSKPNFEESPWHDDVNGNMDKIDSVVTAGIGIANLLGIWDNDTTYVEGDRAVDTDDTIWQVLVDHVSASSGTFLADRTAHPTYWEQISIGFIDVRGAWNTATEYFVGDFVNVEDEYVAAFCTSEHVSTNFRADAANWLFLYDLKAEVLGTIANATAATTAAAEAQVAKIEWKGQWVTATVYDLHDAVKQSGSSYICIVAHTSGTFATDLAATKWELLAQKGTDGAGSGDMAIAVYDPLGKNASAFAMDNMVEGAATKILTATERTKLAGIATGAQANPTDAAIKTAYENNADTNAFTDAEQAKLSTVTANADQTSTTNVGTALNAASALPAIAGADLLAIYDTSAATLTKWTWTNFLAALVTALNTVFAAVSHVHAFASITAKPTTLAGYGITDAAASTHNHDDRYYTEAQVNALLGQRVLVSADTTLPIGSCMLAGTASAVNIVNGALILGSSLQQLKGNPTITFTVALSGTWMNISGTTFVGSGTWCLWKRIS